MVLVGVSTRWNGGFVLPILVLVLVLVGLAIDAETGVKSVLWAVRRAETDHPSSSPSSSSRGRTRTVGTVSRRMNLRVMTYNVQNWDDGQWAMRVGMVVAEIKAADPDIVALQELRRWNPNHPDAVGKSSQADDLERLLPEYDLSWAEGMRSKRWAEGLAIMTRRGRCAVLAVDHQELAKRHGDVYAKLGRESLGDDSNKRICQRAIVTVTVDPDKGVKASSDDVMEFFVVNAHLSFDRRTQKHNVASMVEKCLHPPRLLQGVGPRNLTVLMGDLNTHEDALTVRHVLTGGKYAYPGAHAASRSSRHDTVAAVASALRLEGLPVLSGESAFVDVWAEVHGARLSDVSATFRADRGAPDARCDYVMVRGGERVRAGKVFLVGGLREGVVATANGSSVKGQEPPRVPSDHKAVVANLEVDIFSGSSEGGERGGGGKGDGDDALDDNGASGKGARRGGRGDGHGEL